MLTVADFRLSLFVLVAGDDSSVTTGLAGDNEAVLVLALSPSRGSAISLLAIFRIQTTYYYVKRVKVGCGAVRLPKYAREWVQAPRIVLYTSPCASSVLKVPKRGCIRV